MAETAARRAVETNAITSVLSCVVGHEGSDFSLDTSRGVAYGGAVLTQSHLRYHVLASVEKKISALFEGFPEEPSKRLAAVSEIYDALRVQAARELRPAISALLKNSHGLGYAAKAQLSHDINQVLLDTRLAIVNPRTELPATLISNRPRPTSELSRLYLRDCRSGSDGKRHTLLLDRASGTEVELISTARKSLKDSNRQR